MSFALRAPGLEQQLLQPADGIPAGFFPPETAWTLDTIQRLQAPLAEPESAETARMVPIRVREFTAGRTAARAALHQLAGRDFAIPRRPDRAPAWPAGFCGSISHSRTHAVAIAARLGAITTLGIDLEEDDRVTPDLWPHIVTAEQLRELRALPPPAAHRLASLYFCTAEAYYKALPPGEQRAVLDGGRTGMEVSFRPEPGQVVARGPGPSGPRPLSGRFAHFAGHWIALFSTAAY